MMPPSIPIIPRYKLLLCYDIKPGMQSLYYQYVVREFVPALNEMEIYISAAWHTAYGEYPIRQIDFVADSMETLQAAFETGDWAQAEKRLKSFTTHYTTKIIPYRVGFQF